MQTVLTAKLQKGTASALNWLLRSININKGNGSSAYFSRFRHPLRAWAPAYPETTGYVIETLINYHKFRNDERLWNAAISCADWLLDIQFENGAFTSLYVSTKKPSIFNTAQILFGLRAIYLETKDEKYLIGLRKALQWLENQLTTEGEWESGNYVEEYVPSYYTRVIWPMLLVYELIKKAPPEKIILAFEKLKQRVLPNFAIDSWGFLPNKSAPTHTIAYTLRGFWECGIILNDEKAQTITKLGINKLIETIKTPAKIAGSYTTAWQGDYSYQCVTGNAQLSIIASLLFAKTGDLAYQNFAITLLGLVQEQQLSISLPNWRGSFPGSAPWWGNYMRFKFPNWAVKFYLDAALPFLLTE